MQHRFVKAYGPFKWFLERYGFGGVTTPWGSIYLLEAWYEHEGLRAHELIHIEQMDRDGAWWMVIKYLWWCIRFGYWSNPYEVEARNRSGYPVFSELITPDTFRNYDA